VHCSEHFVVSFVSFLKPIVLFNQINALKSRHFAYFEIIPIEPYMTNCVEMLLKKNFKSGLWDDRYGENSYKKLLYAEKTLLFVAAIA